METHLHTLVGCSSDIADSGPARPVKTNTSEAARERGVSERGRPADASSSSCNSCSSSSSSKTPPPPQANQPTRKQSRATKFTPAQSERPENTEGNKKPFAPFFNSHLGSASFHLNRQFHYVRESSALLSHSRRGWRPRDSTSRRSVARCCRLFPRGR